MKNLINGRSREKLRNVDFVKWKHWITIVPLSRHVSRCLREDVTIVVVLSFFYSSFFSFSVCHNSQFQIYQMQKMGSWYIFLLLDDLNQRQRNNLTVFFLNRFWFQNKTVKVIWLSKFPKKFGVGGIDWSFSWNVRYLSLCFSLQITACNKFNPKSFLKGCFTSGFEQPKSL